MTAVFFFSFSLRALTGSLFWKEAERESLAGRMDGWMDRWRETTPQALMEKLQAAWRQEHARPQVAMGTGVHGESNGHGRLCLCPGLNALRSICQHGQKGGLEERKHSTSVSAGPISTRERSGDINRNVLKAV